MALSYISRYKKEWEELDTLVTRARKSIRRLTPEELSRLDVLYRRTSAHLAQVSSRTTDQGLIQYLNSLTAAAHSIIYLPPRKRLFAGVPQYLAAGFADAVVHLWKFHLLSGLLLLIGALVAYASVSADPGTAYALMPAGESRQPGASKEQLLEVLRHGRDQGSGTKFAFASFLFSHNVKVGILALASGALAAIPTVILMIYNGMILGAFTAVHYRAGITSEYWAWILPHGVTEILAIVLCGGIGMRLGQGVLCPGLLTRSESLRLAGEDAVRTVVGVILMLSMAAVIESYLRQSHMSQAGRFTFAGFTFVFWAVYFATGHLRKRTLRELNDSILPL